jgi:hypothetical protein
MIKFEINGKQYSFCQNKEDISIKRFIQIIELEKAKLPQCLRKIQELSFEYDKLENDKEEDHSARLQQLEGEIQAAQDDLYSEENEPLLLEWQIHLATALSDCPFKIWEKVEYDSFLAMLDFGYAAINEIKNYQPKHIKSIYWKDEEYFLPAEKLANTTLGQVVQVKEFQRQTKRLKAGYYSAILNMLPCILLKKDEQYSFEIFQQRKGLFDDIPVADAMDVAFFLTSKVNASNRSILICSIAETLSKLKKKRKR